MSQGNPQLPDLLLADLYRHSLVVVETEAKKPAPEPERQWFLGSNLQKITLIVSEPDAVYLGDESLQFLSSILGACKLNLGDVAIINLAREQTDYNAIKQRLTPRYLVMFGVTAAEIKLPFTVPHYQVQPYDKCDVLLAPALQLMLGTGQDAKLEKSKLWLCLRKMFGI